MIYMDARVKLKNPCVTKKDFCVNCHSHFMMIRPSLRAFKNYNEYKKFLDDRKEIEKMIVHI